MNKTPRTTVTDLATGTRTTLAKLAKTCTHQVTINLGADRVCTNCTRVLR